MHNAGRATETIVAVSTAAGVSARAIVRLSGPEALRIVRSLSVSDMPDSSYQASNATLVLESLRLPVRIYVMRAPASYTREDVVELHTFGSPVLLGALMDELVRGGARPAGPGEFTRRAFMNGRIDLAQAEAVEALIHARDEGECRAALDALNGGLARAIASAREQLSDLAALVELSLDFSDQDVEILSVAQAVERLEPIRRAVAGLADQRDSGRVARPGVRVLLFGPPNAGKSSLFNRILNRSRAIVSPHPGTTRDTVEAAAVAGGLDLTLVDTAGLRQAEDEIEALAVGRSRDSLRGADVLLCVLDASAPPSDETREALACADAHRSIIVLNKSDLGPCDADLAAILPHSARTIPISAATGEGAAELLETIRARVESGIVDRAAGGLMVNARQADLLHRTGAALERAAECAGENDMELLAADVREALHALAECTGSAVTDDILNRIFSSFCIGK